MTTERILRQIEEIKELAQLITDAEYNSEINRIISICEDIEISHQIEERLKNEIRA